MKILIIEDEAKLALVLEQGLEEYGHQVKWASDGSLGLEMILLEPFDAIILDVMLPKRDGFEVLKTIRTKGGTVPVVMLTARGRVEDRIQGLDLGADDYLTKPFDFQELLARLRAVTRRPQTEIRTVLSAADLEMDLQSRRVQRAGQPISLSTKEFAILEYLLRRKGLVLTKGMIMDQVWASDADGGGNSNLVEVYINFLRKKVDQGHAVKLIQTVRGSGYVIKDPE